MNLEASLNYVTVHSQSIIQWVFLAIVLLVGILIAHALFGRRETEVASGAGVLPSAELNAALSKLLEQNAHGAVSAPAAHAPADHGDHAHASAAPADASAPSVEIEGKLKKLEFELRAKDEELAKLRSGDGAAAPASAPGAMADRLHELETKLAEYEILEDDIADLSLYKEENTRLRAELEAMRGDGDADAGPAESGTAAPSAPAARTGEPEADAAPARIAVAAAEAAASLAAFDEPVAAAPAPPVQAAAPAANEPTRHDLAEGADDLFAEFATALEESGVDLSSDAPKGETGT